MSDTKWTKGPWSVHHRMRDCVTFEGRHGTENLFLENVDGYYACQSTDDAHLIAAAPDLYNALATLADAAESRGIPVNAARAALAKARSES
jgi:hypothetical protein